MFANSPIDLAELEVRLSGQIGQARLGGMQYGSHETLRAINHFSGSLSLKNKPGPTTIAQTNYVSLFRENQHF
jgi:hypothetical protein